MFGSRPTSASPPRPTERMPARQRHVAARVKDDEVHRIASLGHVVEQKLQCRGLVAEPVGGLCVRVDRDEVVDPIRLSSVACVEEESHGGGAGGLQALAIALEGGLHGPAVGVSDELDTEAEGAEALGDQRGVARRVCQLPARRAVGAVADHEGDALLGRSIAREEPETGGDDRPQKALRLPLSQEAARLCALLQVGNHYPAPDIVVGMDHGKASTSQLSRVGFCQEESVAHDESNRRNHSKMMCAGSKSRRPQEKAENAAIATIVQQAISAKPDKAADHRGTPRPKNGQYQVSRGASERTRETLNRNKSEADQPAD